MSTQITRLPVGLQGFLGTQAQGQNPSELSQLVVPTIPIEQFLAVQQEKWYATGVGQFNANKIETVDVPEGEVWILKGIGVDNKGAATAVDESYTVSFGMLNNVNSNGAQRNHPLADPYKYVESAGGGRILVLRPLNNVIATAGSRIGWYFQQVNTANNFDPEVFLNYLRLEA